MQGRDVYLLAARRTPFGRFWGALKDIAAPKLAATAIAAVIQDADVKPEEIAAVHMGHVLTAGTGQNPARQAARLAGLPDSCPAETVNKVCSSSLVAAQHAARMIALGEADLVVAGGMESMSRAPYLLARRERMSGHRGLASMIEEAAGEEAIDSMLLDGLCDADDPAGLHMGALADLCAATHAISREEQEAYAARSHIRLLGAQRAGELGSQLVPVVTGGREPIASDEGPREPDMEKMRSLSATFGESGTVTAATSSQISDGAAALLLGTREAVEALDLPPLARVLAFATHSQSPDWYTTAPVGAIQKLLKETGLSLEQIDLFEINEAFAVVPIYAMRTLDLPEEKVNVWGGAIAIGHPIGASGARIFGNLAHALKARRGRYGIAVTCNGGGEAVGVLLESGWGLEKEPLREAESLRLAEQGPVMAPDGPSGGLLRVVTGESGDAEHVG